MSITHSIRAGIRHRLTLPALYLTLLVLYTSVFWREISNVLRMPDILIAPIMSLGSFVAGSTFLGGGAIAFPALTKILGTDPSTAKTFSFAIQSVGMTSASLYILSILSRVPKLPIKFMLIYLSGTCIGLLISLLAFQNIFTTADIRIGFTLFVLCFLMIYLGTHKNVSIYPEHMNSEKMFDHEKILYYRHCVVLIMGCGLLGGVITGLIGSGADLLAFCLLALFFRIEIKLATQVSVIIMACTSILGITLQAILFENVTSKVLDLWYIAAPIVLFGAPLGAIFCKRTTTSSLVIFICLIICTEVASTIWLVDIAVEKILFYFLVFSITLIFLTLLFLLSPYHRQDGYKRS